MTCIVGLIDSNKNVYIGGDSAGTAGSERTIRKDPKVFIRDKFIMGFTSSFRMGQLLMADDRFKIREHKKEEDDFYYMINAFIPAVQQLFADGGYLSIDKNVKEGGIFLCGYNGRLYKISSDFQVGESVDDYSCIGCGEEYALGSLFSTDGQPVEDRVLKALEASAYFNNAVSAPFTVLKLEYKK